MNAVTSIGTSWCGMPVRLAAAEPYSVTKVAITRTLLSVTTRVARHLLGNKNFVSAYATSHPWEDFAESFAHYLHIIDTLETARAFGIRTRPEVPNGDVLRAKIDFDPHRCRDINQIIDVWLPLTLAMNCINRSMGQPDLYPFVLSPSVIKKLGYIGNLIHVA